MIAKSRTKYWEKVAERLADLGWQVRWVEAMHDGEPGWTVTACKGDQRHCIHANQLTLAFQELEEICMAGSPTEDPIRKSN